MKWSGYGFILVVVALLSFGRPIKPSDTPERRACRRPELLLSMLDIDRYNKSYPYVDYQSVLNPILDFMLRRGSFVTDCVHDLFVTWVEVCKAEDPKAEIEAMKILAREITHILHTDESMYKISKLLFGDRMAAWVMNPPDQFLDAIQHDDDCIRRKRILFQKHCGEMTDCGFFKYLNTYDAICALGVVQDDEFAAVAEETCNDYAYIPNPLWRNY